MNCVTIIAKRATNAKILYEVKNKMCSFLSEVRGGNKWYTINSK